MSLIAAFQVSGMLRFDQHEARLLDLDTDMQELAQVTASINR